jgi:hypothetical protein
MIPAGRVPVGLRKGGELGQREERERAERSGAGSERPCGGPTTFVVIVLAGQASPSLERDGDGPRLHDSAMP